MNRKPFGIAALSVASGLASCSNPGHASGGPDSAIAPIGDGAAEARFEADSETALNSGAIVVDGPAVTAQFVEGQTAAAAETNLASVDSGPGSCVVSRFPGASTGGGTSVSAGTVTVRGGPSLLVLAPITAPLAEGGTATSYAGTEGTLVPGSALTVEASGATVPAFALDLPVADAVTFTEPDIADAAATGALVIARSADFPIAWTGGGPVGDVVFAIRQSDGTTETDLVCTFPESAGSGVIPAAALTYLTPTLAFDLGPFQGAYSTLTVQLSSAPSITVGDWTIVATVRRTVLQERSFRLQ